VSQPGTFQRLRYNRNITAPFPEDDNLFIHEHSTLRNILETRRHLRQHALRPESQFLGFDDAARFASLLQWGESQTGGGPFWSISNWYIDPSGHVSHSDSVPVLPGQVLTGIISLGQGSSGLFSYVVSFAGYPTLDLRVTGIEELVCAAETLEAYQIGDRTEYPSDTFTAMSNIAIAVGGIASTLTWTIQNNSTTCGEHAVIASSANPGGQINIVY